MAEGFRLMPLGLLGWELFGSAHGLLRCNIDACVNAHARGGVSLRDVTISRDGKQSYKVRVTSRTGSARRILGISKKVRELKLDTEREGSTFGACWSEAILRATGTARDGGQMKKTAKNDCVSLSLCQRTFKLKGNKRFVPELRSRYVVFVISRFLCSMWSMLYI